MTTSPKSSPELRALDLPLVNLEGMTADELDLHRDGVLATIHELDGVLAKRPSNSDIARAIESRRLRLLRHLARLPDVTNARIAEGEAIALERWRDRVKRSAAPTA